MASDIRMNLVEAMGIAFASFDIGQQFTRKDLFDECVKLNPELSNRCVDSLRNSMQLYYKDFYIRKNGVYTKIKQPEVIRGTVSYQTREDLTGKVVGNLTVIKPISKCRWECKCICGNVISKKTSELYLDEQLSCGCTRREVQKQAVSTHKESHTRLFKIWTGMRGRCNTKTSGGYKDYGGRGIKVDERWNDFNVFKKWALDNGYADNLSIDRIDVNGNYCPENCRWITMKDQAHNKRTTKYIIYNNEKLSATQMAVKYGVNASTLLRRLRKGWSTEECINGKNKINIQE